MDVLRQMRQMFPDHSRKQLIDALNRADDDFNAAVEILLTERPVAGPSNLDIDQRLKVIEDSSPLTPASSSAASFGKLNIIDLDDEAPVKPNLETPPPENEETQAQAEAIAVENVLAIFPDACKSYIGKIYHQNYLLQGPNIVDFIANLFAENGYNRVERIGQKRKRNVDEEPDVEMNYDSLDRPPASPEYCDAVRKILHQEFPLVPAHFIDKILKGNRHFLAPAFSQLSQYQRNNSGRYKKLVNRRKMADKDDFKIGKSWVEVSEELEYARLKARKLEMDTQMKIDEELALKLNEKEHEDTHNMMECACCFGDYPIGNMTHCNEVHFFCLECARKNAENEIGNGRHQLKCMDGSGCSAEFDRQERLRFLDETSQMALDKLEQEEVIRVADIAGLVKCPFCDYAAICEPIEVDKEFRCQNFECMEVSCRHCERKSHLPKTCEEMDKEDKIDHRHTIEEAMTAAMVRKCNKCKSPFIKESGCNKMTCTKAGCRSIQCYVCSKTVIGYEHFNDQTKGGVVGNCPLFDNVEERHDQEIQEAAKAAMAKVKEQNPDLTDDDLAIKISDEVKRREAERALNANPAARARVAIGGVRIPQYIPGQHGAPPMGVRRDIYPVGAAFVQGQGPHPQLHIGPHLNPAELGQRLAAVRRNAAAAQQAAAAQRQAALAQRQAALAQRQAPAAQRQAPIAQQAPVAQQPPPGGVEIQFGDANWYHIPPVLQHHIRGGPRVQLVSPQRLAQAPQPHPQTRHRHRQRQQPHQEQP